MTSSVTAPLERQFGQMPGLNQMSSTSSGGASVITLQFSLDADARRRRAGGAGGDQRRRQLPARRPAERRRSTPRSTRPTRRSSRSALTSTTMPLTQVQDLADTRLAQKISQLPRRRPGQHQRRPAPGGAHPGQSARRSPPTACQLDDLRTAIANANVNQAEGQLRRADPRLDDRRQRPAEDRRRVPRARSSPTATARRCALRDVADVVDGAENARARRLDEQHARRSSSTSSASPAPT